MRSWSPCLYLFVQFFQQTMFRNRTTEPISLKHQTVSFWCESWCCLIFRCSSIFQMHPWPCLFSLFNLQKSSSVCSVFGSQISAVINSFNGFLPYLEGFCCVTVHTQVFGLRDVDFESNFLRLRTPSNFSSFKYIFLDWNIFLI